MFRRILALGMVIGFVLGVLALPISSSVSAQGTPVASPCPELSNEDLRTFVQSWGRAIADKDIAALAGLVAEDVVRDVPTGNDSGRDEVVATFERFFTAYPDLSLTVDLVLVDTPFALVHYTATGTQAVPFAGADPTGNPATWAGMYLLQVDCGQIAEMWTEIDQLSQRHQGTSSPIATVESDAASPEPCVSLTEDVATSLVDTWTNGVWEGNLDDLEAVTTSDIYYHWSVGTDTSGQAEQRVRLQATLDSFGAATGTYDALIVDGDYIAFHWEASQGDDAFDGLSIFRIECGLIDEVWSETNLNDLPGMSQATPEQG